MLKISVNEPLHINVKMQTKISQFYQQRQKKQLIKSNIDDTKISLWKLGIEKMS